MCCRTRVCPTKISRRKGTTGHLTMCACVHEPLFSSLGPCWTAMHVPAATGQASPVLASSRLSLLAVCGVFLTSSHTHPHGTVPTCYRIPDTRSCTHTLPHLPTHTLGYQVSLVCGFQHHWGLTGASQCLWIAAAYLWYGGKPSLRAVNPVCLPVRCVFSPWGLCEERVCGARMRAVCCVGGTCLCSSQVSVAVCVLVLSTRLQACITTQCKEARRTCYAASRFYMFCWSSPPGMHVAGLVPLGDRGSCVSRAQPSKRV